MRWIDRYLFRELLIPFAYCLLGFFIFWLSFDLFSNLSDLQKRQLLVIDVMEYYVVKTPELLSLVLPITLLLALLYALSNHARYHELIALRAAGISLARISLPYFIVGFVLTLAVFGLNEWWLPQSAERTDQILGRYDTNKVTQPNTEWEQRVGFLNTRANRTWVMQAFHRVTSQLIRPHIKSLLPDGSRRDFLAEAGAWDQGQWYFTNVQEYLFPPGRGATPLLTNHPLRVMTELNETPEEIRIQIKLGKIQDFREARKAQLSIRDLLIYRKLYPDDAQKTTLLHGRLASPWTCIVVVLIALPFGAAPGRRNVFVGMAASIVICFVYFILQQLSLAVGFRGLLPGWVAAWFPNALFGLSGLFLILRIR